MRSAGYGVGQDRVGEVGGPPVVQEALLRAHPPQRSGAHLDLAGAARGDLVGERAHVMEQEVRRPSIRGEPHKLPRMRMRTENEGLSGLL